MSEKRRHRRFGVDVTAVSGTVSPATAVKIVDISSSGISIKADRRLQIGNEYPLRLADKERVIRVKGTVIWSSLVESRKKENGETVPVYRSGMRFNGLSESEAAAVLHFIERYKTGDRPAPRCGPGKETPRSPDSQISLVPREIIERAEYLCVWNRTMGHYKVLGIKSHATQDEIRDAYHAMARQFHPDKYPQCPADIRETLHSAFSCVSTAYATLIDPKKRKAYDATRTFHIRG